MRANRNEHKHILYLYLLCSTAHSEEAKAKPRDANVAGTQQLVSGDHCTSGGAQNESLDPCTGRHCQFPLNVLTSFALIYCSISLKYTTEKNGCNELIIHTTTFI